MDRIPLPSAASQSEPGCRVVLAFNLKRVPLSVDDSDAEYDPWETIQTIAASIESLGHTVICVEADREFPVNLARARPHVVFNISEGLGGRAREAYVPAVCEMMGVAYTGSDPTTLAIALDKAVTKTVLQQNGVPTPRHRLIRAADDLRSFDLTFPVIVKPSGEGSSKGLLPSNVVTGPRDLGPQVERLLTQYAQPVIAEECLPGREFTVGFLGPGEPEALPLLELEFLDPSRPAIYDIELKQDPPDKIRHVCPAEVDSALAEQIQRVARRAFHALECRDVSRVDVRLDRKAQPCVLEVNPLPGLAPLYSDICKMTEALGWPHAQVISRILNPALARRTTSRKRA